MAIDLTNRYATSSYMRGGVTAWSNNRTLNPVSRGMLHHTAGWYLKKLGTNASEKEETAEIDAIARDHFNRFGIGPGYYYFAFPSGRLYAVGKWGTHRAHTKWFDPDTRKYHNRIGIAICAVGNYEDDKPTKQMLTAIEEGIREVEGFAGRKLPWTGHGRTPSVDAGGSPVIQGTLCPGKYLLSWLDSYLEARNKPIEIRPKPLKATDVSAWTQAWQRGTENPRYEGEFERHEIVIPRRKVK